jgi:branched-chain amino acid transport system substrate-binding protein
MKKNLDKNASAILLLSSLLSCVERPLPLEPVRVGNLASTSGALTGFGKSLQLAVELAVDDVNASGGVYDGRPLELVTVSTNTDPATAAEQATVLVRDGITAIIGPESSGQVAQVLEVTRDAQVPVVSCCATAKDLTENNASRTGYFFRTAPSDELQAQALAYIANNGVNADAVDVAACNEAVLFSRSDDYGLGFIRNFKSLYDGRVLYENAFDNIESPSQSEILAKASEVADVILAEPGPSPALCIVVITFGSEGAEFISKLDDALNTDGPFTRPYRYLVADGAQESAFLAGIGSQTQLWPKIVGTVPFHASSPSFDAFRRAFRTRYNLEPSSYAAQAYDATVIVALALAKARGGDGVVVRDALFSVGGSAGTRFDQGHSFGEVAAALREGTINYVGPSGDVDFSPFGNVTGDYMIWQIDDDVVAGVPGFVDREPLPVSVFGD